MKVVIQSLNRYFLDPWIFALFICFFALFLAGIFLLEDLRSFLLGLSLMSFLTFSMALFVKGFLYGQSKFLSTTLVVMKLPVSLGVVFFVQSMPGFSLVSFIAGILILLPSLVVLSYRYL